jgi:hypothetical protein
MAADELTLEQREGVDAPEFRDDPEHAGAFLTLKDALATIDAYEHCRRLLPEIADQLRRLARRQDGLSEAQLGVALGRTNQARFQGFQPSIHGALAPQLRSSGRAPRSASRPRERRPTRRSSTRRLTRAGPSRSDDPHEPSEPSPLARPGGHLSVRSRAVSAPAVLTLIQLETAIRVAWDCLNEGEEERLRDWIEAHPDYGQIIARALDLAEHEQAA